MAYRTSSLAWVIGTLLCVLFAAVPARAALGQHVSSVETDRRQMRGTLQVIPAQGYALHEIRAANGAVVHEYVSPAGWVFAVSWQGRTMPDLVQLLGSWYPIYRKAMEMESSPRRRGPLVVRSGNLVVQLSGRMRAHSGRAWLTGLVPAGLSPEVIR